MVHILAYLLSIYIKYPFRNIRSIYESVEAGNPVKIPDLSAFEQVAVHNFGPDIIT